MERKERVAERKGGKTMRKKQKQKFDSIIAKQEFFSMRRRKSYSISILRMITRRVGMRD